MTDRTRTRVVLMQPPLRNIVGAATPDYVDENRGHTPPMGLLYVQAACERAGHDARFLDADLEGWDYEEAASKALEQRPDVIGIQALSFTLPDAYRLASAIKELDPETPVLMGGPHPTIYPEETAGLEFVDFALAGEGETSMVEFLDAFHSEEARAAVPGIACTLNGAVRFTPGRGFSEDMDTLPFPARSSSPFERYGSVLAERNPITIMITSRGCPFKCIFCNRMGRKYRFHSAEYVLREFDAIAELGIREVFIHDDTFTLKRDRIERICEGLIERGHDLFWEARTRVDCVDERLLALMRRAGCKRLSFGVESGSEKVLELMRKGIDLKRIEEVFSWCRSLDIITLADFMVGNLGETREDIDKSLALMKRIDPDYVQFSMCSPYPGTPLYELALEKKLYPHDVWQSFAKNPLQPFRGPLWTENFTEEELTRIVAAAYRSFYMRPAFIWKQMKKVRSLSHLKTMAKAALGMLFK